jgi:hypothetical protein
VDVVFIDAASIGLVLVLHDGLQPGGCALYWFATWRLQTYIVTSKLKRISVAAGFVHMMNLLNR